MSARLPQPPLPPPPLPSPHSLQGVVSNAQAANILSDERVEENDLIAGVYEGGFKTWEGGLDLAQFVALQLQQQRAAGQQEQPAEGQQAEQQAEQQGQEQQWAAQLGPSSRVMELVSCPTSRAISASLVDFVSLLLSAHTFLLPCCLQQGDHGSCTATTANSSPHLCLNNATCLCMSPQGCGHGLPGLVALWAGAEVHFQVGTSSASM